MEKTVKGLTSAGFGKLGAGQDVYVYDYAKTREGTFHALSVTPQVTAVAPNAKLNPRFVDGGAFKGPYNYPESIQGDSLTNRLQEDSNSMLNMQQQFAAVVRDAHGAYQKRLEAGEKVSPPIVNMSFGWTAASLAQLRLGTPEALADFGKKSPEALEALEAAAREEFGPGFERTKGDPELADAYRESLKGVYTKSLDAIHRARTADREKVDTWANETIHRAVSSGVIPVIAAGNSGAAAASGALDLPDSALASSATSLKDVIRVGATTLPTSGVDPQRAGQQQQVADFSSPSSPVVVAPGELGTSVAAPRVAALIANAQSERVARGLPPLTAPQFAQVMRASAIPLGGSGPDAIQGAGALDPVKFMRAAVAFAPRAATADAASAAPP